jgi:hypothetical protein
MEILGQSKSNVARMRVSIPFQRVSNAPYFGVIDKAFDDFYIPHFVHSSKWIEKVSGYLL